MKRVTYQVEKGSEELEGKIKKVLFKMKVKGKVQKYSDVGIEVLFEDDGNFDKIKKVMDKTID